MVDQFGFPSMPKREIVGNLIEKIIVEERRLFTKREIVDKECFQSFFCH